MENLLTPLLPVTNWILGGLIVLPILAGIAAFLAGKHEKLRTFLVWITAIIILAGGALLTVLSMDISTAGKVWELRLPSSFAMFSFVLELAVLAIIGIVAVRIKNLWITVFAVLQLGFAIAAHFTGAHDTGPQLMFRIDSLARILLLVTSVVGSMILIFSLGYMKEHAKHAPEGAGSAGRFYFFFISFLGFMIGLVTSNSFSFFSAFWEATTLCSYALIGQDGGDARRINATRALLINSFGGVLLLAAVLILKSTGNGSDFQTMFHASATGATLLPAVLLCLAAFTKSALFPFQSWLLGAMVAPTPVSALLHAATMVKAGVYLVLRITPVYYQYPTFMMMLAFAGAFSFAGAAFLACLQTNAKKVLAYSTISNLGLVVACAGIESPLAYAAGLSIIAFHAISKGLLFLCVGRIEQKIGSRDIEHMEGMPHRMFFTTSVALIGMMSMLLPPFGMLLSKWLAIEATIRSPFLLLFLVTGSAFTVYFWAKWIGRMQMTGYHKSHPHEEIPITMKFSMSVLAALILVTGLVTMYIFTHVLTRMSVQAFPNMANAAQTMAEQAAFPSTLVLVFLGLGLVVSGFCAVFYMKQKNIRPPYLCGENAITMEEELNPDKNPKGIRSYDFHSVGGKVEHAAFSGYYFNSFFDEKIITRYMNWIAWLGFIVIAGCAFMNLP